MRTEILIVFGVSSLAQNSCIHSIKHFSTETTHKFFSKSLIFFCNFSMELDNMKFGIFVTCIFVKDHFLTHFTNKLV